MSDLYDVVIVCGAHLESHSHIIWKLLKTHTQISSKSVPIFFNVVIMDGVDLVSVVQFIWRV